MPHDRAIERERSLLKRCAVRRKPAGRRGGRNSKPEPIVLPAARAAEQWPDTAMARTCHDLRTPLNAVIGFTDLMRSELYGPVGDRRYAEYLDHIATSARALLKSAEDTLALAERMAGR